jgi:hypothetical protein
MKKGDHGVAFGTFAFLGFDLTGLPGWLRLLGFPITFRRFDDKAHSDGLGGGFDSADLAIDDGADILDVGLEFSLGSAGDFDADAAKVLGLASIGFLPAVSGPASGKVTYACHGTPSRVMGPGGPKIGQYMAVVGGFQGLKSEI